MDELLEWLEGHLGKLSLLLIFFGGLAFAAGVAALFGGLKPDFSPLYPLLGGPAAVVVGICLYVRQTWAILIALLLCLGVTTLCGFAVASDLRSGVLDPKSITGGVFFVGCALALLLLLARVVAVGKWAGVSERVFEGVVVEEVGPGRQCRVRLVNGERVVFSIPRQMARVLDRVRPGDQVWLRLAGPLRGKYRVLDFGRDRAEPGGAADRPRE
jgi:translation initiation factor IF-1